LRHTKWCDFLGSNFPLVLKNRNFKIFFKNNDFLEQEEN
jgi:hypothetical protein